MHKKYKYEKKRICILRRNFKKKVSFFLKNRYLFLVNKERGIKVYPIRDEDNTLINILDKVNVNLTRFGLLNRLDKYSSGIIVFCRKEKVFKKMIIEQKKKKIKKFYIALVKGFTKFKKKKVTCFLKGKKGCFYSFKKKKEYKFSSTNFILLNKGSFNNEGLSLVKCITNTGRYHQIRKHLKIINLCLFNDKIYDRKTKKNGFFLNLYMIKYRSKKITTDFRFFLLDFYFDFTFDKKVILK
ncbi:TRNA pseudouridine synthase A [Candidatus Vidania fulgoroideae]|nr:TRNA pseudouridine synthase A [Candidatus Vidania fulgoroideae]